MHFVYQSFYKILIISFTIQCHFSTICNGDSIQILDLSSGWVLTNQNASITKSNLKLPSGVYSALYGEDVLNSYNDINMRWISYDNWTYSRKFSVKDVYSIQSHVNLTFHGLDTVAEIRLNHRLLGRTNNMFVRYTYDITKILEEDNLLEIDFTSPIAVARSKASSNDWVPPECPIERYHGECHVNQLRKMQASFAWDWGLAAPSMGIWKSVTLEYYEVALIRDVDVIISKNDTHWNMKVKVYMDAVGKQNFYANLKFYAVELLDDSVVIADYVEKPITIKNPVIEFHQSFLIENVKMWWPNGYGDQKLYPLHITVNAWFDKSGPSLRNRTTSTKSIRVGFRTIELVEQTAPANDGNTFFFKVNGYEMFMKGSNYIPSHILPELGQDQDRIKHLLQSAKEANMNMIRVWGGGVYETDYFYDLADNYGLLIWHDMMFACAMYPVTDEFLSSVRLETLQNAKRISHHASIAIFATNNENEIALVSDWYGTHDQYDRFKYEYRELYLGNVMHELETIQQSPRPRPLVSSPSNGNESVKDNYISDDPQSNFYGDIHFYAIYRDNLDPSIYNRPRFASEYGFQSLPKFQSWNRSKGINDDFVKLMNHRQHYPMGMLPISSLISRHFPLPLPEDENYFDTFIYLSQLVQAMAIKTETQLYRFLRDTNYRTMGALYWQLNDVWIAPSWSSIDFYGNYKILHYWAKEFMASISIIALYDSSVDSVSISLTCDCLTDSQTKLKDFQLRQDELNVTASVYRWSDLYPRKILSWPAVLKLNGVQYDKVISVDTLLTDKLTRENSFVEFVLHKGTSVLSTTYYFPSPIKYATGVTNPNISLKISWHSCESGSNKQVNSYSLTVAVDYPAIFVYLELRHPEVSKYTLSRNGFMQLEQVQMVHLEFESDDCITLHSNDIKVMTVNELMI